MTAIETAKAYYQYFNEKRYDQMLSLVDENILHEPNQGTPRNGKVLFEQFLKYNDDRYQESLSDLVFFEGEKDGRVSVEFTVNGIYKMGDEGFPEAKGQSYILPAAAFLDVKNGKICRVTTYYNLELWLTLVS